MPSRKPSPNDLLTARQVADEYGYPLSVAQSLLKNLSKHGKTERIEGFRRVFVRRKHIEPQQGGPA